MDESELTPDWPEILALHLAGDGYIVCGSPVELQLGEQVTEAGADYVVTGSASYEDAIRQYRRCIESKYIGNLEPPPNWMYFYKMELA